MITSNSGTGPVFYAFTLGLVAAVNPCGFPMLPAYLALFSGTPGPGRRRSGVTGALLAGAVVSAGFVAVFGLLGLLIESGTRLATDALPWIMAAIGLAMVVAGLATLLGRAPAVRLPSPRMRPGRSLSAMALYGVAYATGSLSCSLPLFLASVTGSFTAQGLLGGLSTYFAYALGMALFVTAAAVVTTTAGTAALGKLKTAGRWMPALSGTTLTLSGAYLSYYWLTEKLDPAEASPVTSAVTLAQNWLASRIADQPVLCAVLLAAVVLAAIAFIIRRTLTEPHDQSTATTPPVPAKGRENP